MTTDGLIAQPSPGTRDPGGIARPTGSPNAYEHASTHESPNRSAAGGRVDLGPFEGSSAISEVEFVFLELADDLGEHAPVGAPEVIHESTLRTVGAPSSIAQSAVTMS